VSTHGRGYERLALGTLPSNDVTAIAGDGEGRVALGTFDHGAAIVEGDTVSAVGGLEPTETINAASWQGHGSSATLWLGTARGLTRLAPHAPLRRLRADDGLPSSSVRSLLVQPDGRLLVGTDEGAAWVEGERVVRVTATDKGGPSPLASPAHATWALAESTDGTIWLGTNVGLYFGRPGSFRRAALATGDLKDDWVTALAIHDADVFVGTYAGGVTRLRAPREPGDALEHTHLGGGCINPGGLTLVGDELFAATMEGLLVRPAGDDHAAWIPRTAATPGRDVTAVLKVQDTLWVASRRGVGVTRR
jgi:ligand-binding sensor domain-containing protein